MCQEKEIIGAVSLIQNHFAIPENELGLQNPNMQDLEKNLTKIISVLLNQDMERLLQAFYRIDLDEKIFKQILTTDAPENISKNLAREVIKREIMKVRMREKYKNL